jgi:peptide subunit release factor 1 (eRF1)
MPHNKPALTIETCPPVRFGPDTLDQIGSLQAPDDGLLSVYLNVEPSEAQREGFEATLLDLWKPLRASIRDTDLVGRLEDEIERVNDYVRSWPEPPGRSVAMFTSAPAHTFIPVALDVPVLPVARFTARAYLLPLIAALDEHERYCVALVDRERARIMTVFMGRIDHRTEFVDDLPGRVTRGGGWSTAGRESSRPGMARGIIHSSQGGYARHINYHVHLHMQRVVDEVWRLRQSRAFDRLIVGGPPEAMNMLRQALPRSVRSLVVGEFSGELFASDEQVVARVRAIEEDAERAQEKALVEKILNQTLERQLAVTGWDDTLTALCEGSVHELALIEGESVSGYICPEGHFAVTERVERCPLCEEPVWHVDVMAAWAMQRALATDAYIEFVRGEAAELLRPHGAGATLRYR